MIENRFIYRIKPGPLSRFFINKDMTLQEFKSLRGNRPLLNINSIYRLRIRNYNNRIQSYILDPETGEYSFDIWEIMNLYSTKEEAIKALTDYIVKSNNHIIIHSAGIERITVNTLIEDGGVVEWWLYNKSGQEIDHSTCSEFIREEPDPSNFYYGRQAEEIRFNIKDIVEVILGDKVILSIVNDIPPTVKDMWSRYEKNCERWEGRVGNKKFDFCFGEPMTDSYYYVNYLEYDMDISPCNIFTPTFLPSNNMIQVLNSRYKNWERKFKSGKKTRIGKQWCHFFHL